MGEPQEQNMVARDSLRLDPVAAIRVHMVQQDLQVTCLDELVHGLTTSVIGAVVVDDDDAGADDLVVEVLQADLGGGVPVPIQPQEGDGADLGGILRERVLKPALVVVDPVAIVAEGSLEQRAVSLQGSGSSNAS